MRCILGLHDLLETVLIDKRLDLNLFLRVCSRLVDQVLLIAKLENNKHLIYDDV